MQTRAIRIHEHGGPEVLRWETVEVGEPGPGQALVRHEAVGLNFIDTYHRTGLYPVEPLPAVLGVEAAGEVEAVGPPSPGSDAPRVRIGDHVAYCQARGAYSERRLVDTDRLVVLPDHVDAEMAAASMLKGLTAWYLLRRTYPVRSGETVLVHAAAGGVGTILCQWAKALGATVIGTVGTEAKAEMAASSGCDHPIVYTVESFVERVLELTGGTGVPVVYDGVGKATFDDSLKCLDRFGMMVSFGNASGPVPPFEIRRLSVKNLFLTRPSLRPHVDRPEDLAEGAAELFDQLASRTVRVPIGQRFPLRETATAHRALEARETTGSTILVPGSDPTEG